MRRIFILTTLALIALPLCLHAFEYSFMNTPATLNFAVDLLRSEGIAEANITVWTNEVVNYNRHVQFYSRTGNLRTTRPEDLYDNSLCPFVFVNCHVGLFLLVRDLIEVDRFARPASVGGGIRNEIDAIKRDFGMTNAEEKAYKSLLNPVTLPICEPNDALFDTVAGLYRTWWQKEGLSFPENPHLKIAQVVLINAGGKFAFTDHVGLIIDNDRGIYFVEKMSPFNPFVLSKFDNLDELYEYLYAGFTDWNTGGVMILANDEIVWKRVCI